MKRSPQKLTRYLNSLANFVSTLQGRVSASSCFKRSKPVEERSINHVEFSFATRQTKYHVVCSGKAQFICKKSDANVAHTSKNSSNFWASNSNTIIREKRATTIETNNELNFEP